MRILVRLAALVAVILVVCASTHQRQGVDPSTPFPDRDAANLARMSDLAAQLAQKEAPEVILHQVDTDLKKVIYRYTDHASTKEVSILVPGSGVPPEKWIVEVSSKTPLVGNTDPALNLEKLKAGPERVIRALTTHWPGCTVRGLTLYLEKGYLTWIADCITSSGVVTGSMNGETGAFHPSPASPAPLPATATPGKQ